MLNELKNKANNFCITITTSIENYIKSNSDLPNEFFKYLPFIKLIIEGKNTYIAYRDHELYKRIEKLIKKIDPNLEGKNLVEKCLSNGDKDRLFKMLIKNLDNLNDECKTDLMINLFQAYIIDKITYNEFMRFSHIINNTFYEDLKWLENFEGTEFICNNIHIQMLVGTGLIENIGYDSGEINKVNSQITNYGEIYKRSELGKKFCDCALRFCN